MTYDLPSTEWLFLWELFCVRGMFILLITYYKVYSTHIDKEPE